MTVIDSVFEVIKRSRKGATIVNLKEKTGLDSRQLSNALYKLSKRGMVESRARGVYMKK
jgi:DNA-binding MarR family transcriptional regulator